MKSFPIELTIDEIKALISHHIKAKNYVRASNLSLLLVKSEPRKIQFQQIYINIFKEVLSHESLPNDRVMSYLNMAMQFGHFPDQMADFYFDTLEKKYPEETKRDHSGQLVIGLGPGRCGSTSLTAILSSAESACITHEAPPLVTLPATQQQLNFHVRRFKKLLKHHALVGDVSHWWIYNIDTILSNFPDTKFVVMHRDPKAIVDSFIKVKTQQGNGENHWQNHDGSYWQPSFWDYAYPNFLLKDTSIKSPEKIRHVQISAYVRDYYQRCKKIPPEKRFDIQLEQLTATTIDSLASFIGYPLSREIQWKNKDTYNDSLEMSVSGQ